MDLSTITNTILQNFKKEIEKEENILLIKKDLLRPIIKYTIDESEIGYENFCVIETYIKSIEWLYLAAKGHRRAYFSFKNNSLEKKWLIP